MVNSAVLVLNQNYEPLNLCRVRRAIVLVLVGKAEMIENGMGEIHTATIVLPMPSVIRLNDIVRPPRHQRKLTRFQVFLRDNFTCQYCGQESHSLTLDHVIPRYRGGEHIWENIVSACIPCNRHKAGKTPKEAGMHLLGSPREPKPAGFFVAPYYLRSNPQWQKFLPQ